MALVLIVHHTPSPTAHELLAASQSGVLAAGQSVILRPALGATVSDLLRADGVLLGTPANIGYMSGALKHFFDTIYYPVLDVCQGLPYGLFVHGNNDVGGAVRSVAAITGGLGWRAVRPPVQVIGPADPAALQECSDLGALVGLAAAGELAR